MTRKAWGLTHDGEGNRFQVWPIRLKWSAGSASRFFDRHGWQTGTERTPDGSTGGRCMPGYRAVYGQTFHIGRLKVCLGRSVGAQPDTQAPPRIVPAAPNGGG
jgi:hypothetical protein